MIYCPHSPLLGEQAENTFLWTAPSPLVADERRLGNVFHRIRDWTSTYTLTCQSILEISPRNSPFEAVSSSLAGDVAGGVQVIVYHRSQHPTSFRAEFPSYSTTAILPVYIFLGWCIHAAIKDPLTTRKASVSGGDGTMNSAATERVRKRKGLKADDMW